MGEIKVKIEQNEKAMLFSNTQIPDIFLSEHLSNIPGDTLKIYLYLVFLSKYNKTVKVNDLSKKLNLPINIISEGIKYLEQNNLILRKHESFIIVDLQEFTLNNIYTLKIQKVLTLFLH